MIAILSCGARKLTVPAPAHQLYTGPYFSACLRYALTQVPLDQIYILSALHGIVPAERELAPYDSKLRDNYDCRRALFFKADYSARTVVKTLPGETVLALCSGAYLGILREVLPANPIHAPIAGLQIGEALGALKRLCN